LASRLLAVLAFQIEHHPDRADALLLAATQLLQSS
jgi:hypothetical protein